MGKKYGKRTSSNGKTTTPSRRDGKFADSLRGKPPGGYYRPGNKK